MVVVVLAVEVVHPDLTVVDAVVGSDALAVAAADSVDTVDDDDDDDVAAVVVVVVVLMWAQGRERAMVDDAPLPCPG